MKPLFEPQLKKVMSPILKKEYWISDRELSPQDGLPVYSLRELEFIKKKRFKPDELEEIYNTKLYDYITVFEWLSRKRKAVKENSKYRFTDTVIDIIADIKKTLGGKKDV